MTHINCKERENHQTILASK